jgi:dTDP-4-amino-4,6-dideoxygalactose transaminase
MDSICAIAEKHDLPVVGDACQAHLGRWRSRCLGTWGDTGCFSFQASKNLNCGDGGAILTNSDKWADKCYSFHNQCRPRRASSSDEGHTTSSGGNLRMTEFQGALLLSQMDGVEERANTRSENADNLSKMLREIPGLMPARMYDGCTRNAYHLYMFRYNPARFAGLDRAKFIAALGAEGVPASPGYGVMNKDDYVSGLAKNKHFLKLYGEKRLKDWLDRNQSLTQNDKVCEQAVWFTQNMMLAERSQMDQIADAIRKIQKHAAELTVARNAAENGSVKSMCSTRPRRPSNSVCGRPQV